MYSNVLLISYYLLFLKHIQTVEIIKIKADKDITIGTTILGSLQALGVNIPPWLESTPHVLPDI